MKFLHITSIFVLLLSYSAADNIKSEGLNTVAFNEYYSPETCAEYGGMAECYGDLLYMKSRAKYLNETIRVLRRRSSLSSDDISLVTSIVDNLRYHAQSTHTKCCDLASSDREFADDDSDDEHNVPQKDKDRLEPAIKELTTMSQQLIKRVGAGSRFASKCNKWHYFVSGLIEFQNESAAISRQCLKRKKTRQ